MLKKIKRLFSSGSGDLPAEVEEFVAGAGESKEYEKPAATSEPTPEPTESSPEESTPASLDVDPPDFEKGDFSPPMFRADPANPMLPSLIDAMKKVYDPEIPIDIFELGLIYRVDIDEEGAVDIRMTLTSPNCPSAVQIPADVEARIREVEGVTACTVDVIWDPPWGKEMMSEAAMLELGML